MLRLFRFVTGNPTPRLPGPSVGEAPVAGSSTITTSAPKSPRSAAAAGPASHCDRSSTRTPARAPAPGAHDDLASGLGRAAMRSTLARTLAVCSPSRGALTGSRALVRENRGVGAGTRKSRPEDDLSVKVDRRAST